MLATRMKNSVTRLRLSRQTSRQMLEEYMFNNLEKLEDEYSENRLDEPPINLRQYRNVLRKFMANDEDISDEEISQLSDGFLVRHIA